MNSKMLIQHRSDVQVGDLVIIPGTSVRYPIVAVEHSFYSTEIRYDQCGVTLISCITDEEMLQITPA